VKRYDPIDSSRLWFQRFLSLVGKHIRNYGARVRALKLQKANEMKAASEMRADALGRQIVREDDAL